MAKVLNEEDKLAFVITNYGLSRITEAINDPNVEIHLSKIKIGDANFEYYDPTNVDELVHPIPDGSFYIMSKELLEDNLTIALHTVFPESIENCEIREVGIYETINGEDKLFALSTQQPLLKPLISLNYLISVDYYALLKTQNLASVYDQIIIDDESAFVTEQDFQDLMSAILFSESNLMEQINGNSRVIGLNRAQQLSEKINEIQTTFGYTSSYNNFSTLLSYINPDNLFGYWVFNYPASNTPSNSITDLSSARRNMSSNVPVNVLGRKYEGLMPLIQYSSPNYFYLDQGLKNFEFNEGLFTSHGSPTIMNGLMTGMTYSDYVTVRNLYINSTTDWKITFTFTLSDLPDTIPEEAKIQHLFYSQNSNVLKGDLVIDTTGGEPEESLRVEIGNGTNVIGTLACILIGDRTHNFELAYSNGIYTLQSTDTPASAELSSPTPIANNLGNFNIGQTLEDGTYYIESINLEKFNVISNNSVIYAGGFNVYYNEMNFLNSSKTADISFSMGFVVEPRSTSSDRTLLARSNNASNNHVFEITETSTKALRIKLFTDSNNYLTFESGENSIPDETHSIVFTYSAITKNVTVYLNGKSLAMSKEEQGTYTHMNPSPATLYGFSVTPIPSVWADSETITDSTNLYDRYGNLIPRPYNEYEIKDGQIYINGEPTTQDSTRDSSTDLLYAWFYDDESLQEDKVIYTKTLSITNLFVPLYNQDGTSYTGNEFSVVQSGSDFVVSFKNKPTEYSEARNIAEKPLYCYEAPELPEQRIWTNSSSNPTILFYNDGSVYTGNGWHIADSKVYYKEDMASPSGTNVEAPLNASSFITGQDGSPEKIINSNVGLVFVLKEGLSEEKLRAISLNLSATMGKNPCISSYL